MFVNLVTGRIMMPLFPKLHLAPKLSSLLHQFLHLSAGRSQLLGKQSDQITRAEI